MSHWRFGVWLLVLFGGPLALLTEATAGNAESACIILDDEDDEEVCGTPLRFSSSPDASSPDSAAKAPVKRGKEPAAVAKPELSAVILDEDDESNESGFGIQLPDPELADEDFWDE